MEWAQQFIGEAESGFNNVIWTNECTVQLMTHRHFCCWKAGEPKKKKTKVHALNTYGWPLSPDISTLLAHIFDYLYTRVSCENAIFILSNFQVKRLEWAQQFIGGAESGFNNVIWSDECTVQLMTHTLFCCRKAGEPTKTTTKVHGLNTYGCPLSPDISSPLASIFNSLVNV